MLCGACQVVKLNSGLEARLLMLLRERILPVAQRSLRLWRKGDLRNLAPSSHAA